MVAIFTGSGTGLENGSGSVLGGAGLLGQASLGRAGEKLFFNAANGNLVISQQDEFLVGTGPDIGISRTYNSQGNFSDENGDNWRQSTQRLVKNHTGTLNTNGATITRVGADGAETVYTYDSTHSAYVHKEGSGAHDKIIVDSSYWIWTDGTTQAVEKYDWISGPLAGRILFAEDTDGNQLSFTYHGDGRLDKVTTQDGGYTQYSWSGNNITKITTGYTDLATSIARTLTRTYYGYDGSNRLITVTTDLTPGNNSISNGETYVTTYTYDGSSNRVASISQTDGSSIAMLYDGSGRVTQFTQTVAAGETRVTGIVYNTGHTVITDPTGQQIKLYFDAKDRLITIVSPPPYSGAAEQKTRFTYNSNGDVLTVRAADDAGITSYEHDANGNVTKVTDPNGNVTVRTYDANNNLLRESEFFSDLLSHGTDLLTQGSAGSPSSMSNLYTEWSLVNGVATQSASGNTWAAIAARDVVAVQAGQQYTVSAEIKIENATYDSAAGPPIGLGFFVLDENYQTLSHNANWPTGAAATQLLDNGWVKVDYTYTAGANDHFLRPHFYRRPSLSGAGDISVRNFGLIQSNGGQTEVLNTRYVYDSENHLRYVVSAQGHVTEYRYQTGGQLWYEIEYPENGYPIGTSTLTEATMDSWRNGLTDRSATKIIRHTYDSRGNLASSIDFGSASSSGVELSGEGYTHSYYTYDQAGNLLERRTATQVEERFVYDGMNRLVASANLDGGVTTIYFNDAASQTIVRLANGATETSTYNKAGELISHTESHVGYQDNPQKTDISAYGSWRLTRTSAAAIDGNAAYQYSLTQTGLYGGVHSGSISVAAGETVSYRITLMASGSTDHHKLGLHGSHNAWANGNGEDVQAIIVEGPGTLTNAYGSLWNIDDLSTTEATTIEVRRTYSVAQNAGGFFYVGGHNSNVAAGTAVILSAPSLTKTVVDAGLDYDDGSTYAYDKNGRLRVETDNTGNNSYYLYDKQGRKIADINHNGHITEYRYDSQGRITASTRFTYALTAAQLTDLADPDNSLEMDDIRPASHSYDIWEWNVYDDAGRVIQTIDGTGGVAKFEYDNADRLVRTISYVNKLSSSQLTAFETVPPVALVVPTSHANDAINRTFYDLDGRIVGQLDGEGYLTRSFYDKNGQLIRETAYAGITDSALRASGTLNELYDSSLLVSTANVVTRYVYDGQGLLRYTVDANRYVTEYVYQDHRDWAAHGLVRSTIAYGTAIAVPGDYGFASVKSAVAAIANGTLDRTSWNVYNEQGQLTYTIDAAGAVTGFAYDQMGQVIKSTQFATLRATTSLPSEATMDSWASSNSADARITRNWYSGKGELRFTVDAEGYKHGFEYDAEGRLKREVTWSDPISVTDTTTISQLDSVSAGTSVDQEYSYDTAGRLNLAYDGEDNLVYYYYRPNGTLAIERAGHGTSDASETRYYYDGAGRKTLDRVAYGQPEQAETYYYYDGLGNLTSVTDPNGNSTTYTYDKRGNMLTATDAEGGVTTYQYDAFGNAVKITDPEGGETYNYYDSQNRLIISVDPERYGTETSYNVFGEVVSVTRRYDNVPANSWNAPAHAQDATTSFAYDKLGRVVSSTDAEGHSESYVLDAFGNRTQVTNKLGGVIDNVYDKRGLLISETLPMASVNNAGTTVASTVTNTFAYDARGNRTQMIEASGLAEQRTTTYEYDGANRLVKTNLPSIRVFDPPTGADNLTARSEHIQYDRRGNIIRTEDANGAESFFYYDDLNRKITEINALGTLSTYVYDKNGNVTSSRIYETPVAVPTTAGGTAPVGTGNSREVIFTYDGRNLLLTSKTEDIWVTTYNGTSHSSTEETITAFNEYDANGNLVKQTDANGNSIFSYYDKLGRKIGQVDAEKYVTRWTYDAEGNVTGESRYAIALTGTITTTLPANLSPAGSRSTAYTYDKVGNWLSEARMNVFVHNGTGGQTNGGWATISYEYNGLGQVTKKTQATGDNTYFFYDQTGRLTQESKTPFLNFDGGNRWVMTDYHYDGLNNLTRTLKHGAGATTAHQITTYTYGAGGMLKSMADASGTTTSYQYDIAGRLRREAVQTVTSTGGSVQNNRFTAYDALGRVIQNLTGNYHTGTGWKYGDALKTQYNAFGEVSSRGINGYQEEFHYDDAGRMWKTNSGDGVWKYYGHDANGNQTVAITSGGGNIANHSLTSALGLIGQENVNGTYTRYDKRNLATDVTEEGRRLSSGGAVQDITSSRSYNAFGETLSETDALGNTTDYTYNNMGRLIKKESPTVSVTSETGAVSNVRPTEHYYYDAGGRLVASRDANSNLTRLTLLAGTGYDGSEALVTQTLYADGSTVSTQYDRHGNARIITDQLSRVTNQSFDAMGRVTQITKPGGLVTNYTYDGLGQRLTEWNNVLGSTNKQTSDYDAQGRVIETRAFGGDVTTTSYTWDATIDNTGMGLTNIGGWTQVTTYANGKTLTETTDLFGQTITRNDLGSNVQNYTYDIAGRLTNISGIGIGYAYFNSGQVSRQTGTGGTADYEYDKLGQRTYEKLVKGADTLKDATIAYDAMGRMTSHIQVATTATPASTIAYTYDAHGNVRSTTTTNAGIDANGNTFGSYTSTRWNRFDSMHRVVTADGNLVSGAIVRGGGTDHLYDAAGQRVRSTQSNQQMSATLWVWQQTTTSQKYWADSFDAAYDMWDQNFGLFPTQQEYYFTGDRISVFNYDDAGQLESVQMGESGVSTNGYAVIYPTITAATVPGAGQNVIATYDYDNMGRLIDQKDMEDGTIVYHRQIAHDNANNRINTDTVISLQPGGTQKAVNTYDYDGLANNAYALGQAVVVTTKNYLNNVDSAADDTRTTNNYIWRDGAVQSQTVFDPNTSSGSTNHTSTFNYNAAGHLTSVGISDGDPRTVTYKTDETGQILQRKETGSNAPGNVRDIYTRFGQAELGRIGNNGTFNTDYRNSIVNRTNGEADSGFMFGATQLTTTEGDFGQGNEQINSYSAEASNSSYTVRSGDTLASIARTVWGDSALWYKIAEANGLSGSQTLAAGTKLHIPHNVTRSTFHASTFKAYDPASALGDTAPTTPTPPKADNGKCGVFGQILIVAIAVAVTIATKGAAAKLLGSKILGGALAGAAGSVASQGFGVATGIQDKFSFKGVALAAVGGGIGGALEGANAFGVASEAARFGSDVVRGALGSAITQGIGVATGLQDKFSFAGVAAAGIGAGVGGAVGRAIGFDPNLEGFDLENAARGLVSGMAGGIAAAATRSAINGDSFGDNLLRELPSTIGNTIGQSIAGAIQGSGTPQKRERTAEEDAVTQNRSGTITGNNGADIRPQSGVDGGKVGYGEIVVTANRYGGNYFDGSFVVAGGKPSELQVARSSGLRFFNDPGDIQFRRPGELLEDIISGDWRRLPPAPAESGRTIGVEKPDAKDDVIVVTGRKGNKVYQDDLDLALLSRIVYDSNSKGVNGYSRVQGEQLRSLGLSSELLIDASTGLKAALFVKDGEYVLAFAGTDELWDRPDWERNIENEQGRLSDQHRQAIKAAEILANNPDIGSLRFTGHSLGGGLASLAAAVTGLDAVTFNAAGLRDSLLSSYDLTRGDIVDRVVAISHRSDPLRNFQRLGAAAAPIGRQVTIGSSASARLIGVGWHHSINDVINSIRKNLR